jgi:cysteine-rich repeat protein
MLRPARLLAIGACFAALLLHSQPAEGHGQPPDLAFYGNFAGPPAVCQQAVGHAARTCFERALAAQQRCMETQMDGGECDTSKRDAAVDAAKRTARDLIAAECDQVALQVLQFLGLDEAQTDVTNACETQTTAALSVMYGPVGGGGAVSDFGPNSDPCLRAAASQARKLVRYSLRSHDRALNGIARSNISPSAKQERMQRVDLRIAQVRQLVMGRIAAACGGFDAFASRYGKNIGGFLDLLETRASCVTGASYVQNAVTCPPPSCGNGAKEGSEECDDGNSIDDDACHDNCTKSSCNFFPTSYQLIQAAIFESKGCTNDACHGSGRTGGLDLRRAVSYQNLVDIPSLASPLHRVEPGDKDRSLLWRKLAAATLGNIPDLEGGPMPSGGLPALSQNELEAMRLWIYSGAPQTGVINGLANLLDACAPAPDPIAIRPPEPPATGEGVQMRMPQVELKPKSETEVCFASYYDFTDQVPPEARSTYGTFRFKTRVETQDPLSHHLIIHVYLGQYDTDDPGWGEWTCKGGAKADQACNPKDRNACGSDGVCGSEPKVAVACLGFGPPDYSESNAPAFGGSQEPLSYNAFPEGVYEELPLRGIAVWNSHAFNLTQRQAKVEAWVNFDFAKTGEQLYPVQGGILDPDNQIFIMNVPAFERKRYCYQYTFARGARVFEIASHMHKRGKLFQTYAPSGELIYNSTQYNDPVHLKFSPPLRLDSDDPAGRTYRYCAEYDNGFTNPAEVKRKSTSPLPPNGVPIGGPCAKATHCTEGLAGAACRGSGNLARDRSCDSSPNAGDGRCDACTLTGGVTTEDEMFLFLATYYCDPAFPTTCRSSYGVDPPH